MSSAIELHLPQVVLGSKHLSYYVAIGAVLFAAWLFQLMQGRKQREVDAPLYQAPKMRWMFEAETLIRDSYTKFRDRVYQIQATEGVQVLIPPNLVGEIKGLPEDILSATEAVSEAMQSRYTKFCLGPHSDTLSYILRSRLSQNLARLVPQLKEELEYITATEFPDCKDWTPVNFQPLALRAVARMSGRAFVGPALNRQEEWMSVSTNFAAHVFGAVVKLQAFPGWMRPVASYFVKELGQISEDLRTATAMMKPVIEERIRDMDLPQYENPPDDLIQWVLEALSDDERIDIQSQSQLQLVLAAASIHSTNNLLTDCIYDLAADLEVQQMLREEAHQFLEANNGWAKKESMAKLKKMDSFIKEVQRLSGNITGFIRKVVKPIELSDGTHLPPGTKLLAPQAGMSHDERFFPNPDSFDPLRFYKMRQESDEAANRWQFTSLSDLNMNFGAGKHACPGRFFAGNELKMALSYFLVNYDIKLKEGQARPRPIIMVMSKLPDPTAEILFRRREVDE